MEVIRKSTKFLAKINAPSEKMGEYEPLKRDENADSDDEEVNGTVLFEHTNVKTAKGKYKRLVPTLCFAVLMLAVFTVVLYFTGTKTLAKKPHFKKPHTQKSQPNKALEVKERFRKTPEWTKTIEGFGTESCIRLVDVDEDGRDDVIFGMTKTDFAGAGDNNIDDMKKTCANAGETFPCAARLVALRGYDGKELWRIRIPGAPFEINCCKIDIDKDGKTDCIASGRMGTVVAFEPRKGRVLWQVDQSVVHQRWNFYNVLVMPDLTLDGVPEVLLSHGGDPQFDANQHKRVSGRLALVDGSNGQSLGRYLNMSRYKETYFSPVLHSTKDGSQYIIYGEGGETCKGAFLAISVPDFFRYVKNLPRSAVVPNSRGSYTSWKKGILFHRSHGVLVIYKSMTKGVMVSPTLVDMNNDGIRDIFMSAYDGTIRLYDGETLDIMWTTRFYRFETYSCFAPGFFNEDEHLDFMIHLNAGVWPNYKYSLKIVFDGRNGKVLWQMNATYLEMTSDLVIRTTEKHRDAFVFRIKGVNGPVKDGKRQRRSLRKSSTILKTSPTNNASTRKDTANHNMSNADRNFAEEFFNNTTIDDLPFKIGKESDGGSQEVRPPAEDKDDPSCADDMTSYTTQFMMLDRSNVHAPNILYQLPSMKQFYNLTEEDKETSSQNKKNIKKTDQRPTKREVYCSVLQNDERTTGVIGDVDGDGELDQVAIVGSEGQMNGEFVYKVRIIKMNVVDSFTTRGRYRSKLDMYVSEEMRNVRGIKPLEEMKFRPVKEQPWTQYMGSSGDGIYRGID